MKQQKSFNIILNLSNKFKNAEGFMVNLIDLLLNIIIMFDSVFKSI